jgi:purine nucleoside phosphorylase
MEKKTPHNSKIAITGGTGLDSQLEGVERIWAGTPYGLPLQILFGEVQGGTTAFLPRHGHECSVPPQIRYCEGNSYAIFETSVERTIATNAVGAKNLDLKPRNLVSLHDQVDFASQLWLFLYDYAQVTRGDFSEPSYPDARKFFGDTAKETVYSLIAQSVYLFTEDPCSEAEAQVLTLGLLGCIFLGTIDQSQLKNRKSEKQRNA